jgi:multiple sugar transport system permease protein
MARANNTGKHKSMSYTRYGYIFIAPFVVIYAIFSLYPLLTTFWYSTTNSQMATADFWGFGDKEIYYDRYLDLKKFYSKLDSINVDPAAYSDMKNFFRLQDLIDQYNPMDEEGIKAIINIGSNEYISQGTLDNLQTCLNEKNFGALTAANKDELQKWADNNSDLTSVIQSGLKSILGTVSAAIALPEETATTSDEEEQLTAETIYTSEAYDNFITTLETGEFTPDQQAFMKYLASTTEEFETLPDYFKAVKEGSRTIDEATFYYICANLNSPNAVGADGTTAVEKIEVPFLATVKEYLNANIWNSQVTALNTYADLDAYGSGSKELHSDEEQLYTDLQTLHKMGLINIVKLTVSGDTCVESTDTTDKNNLLAQLRYYIDNKIEVNENVNKARLEIGYIKNYITDRGSYGIKDVDKYLTFEGSFDKNKYYDFKKTLSFSEPLDYDRYKAIEQERKDKDIAEAKEDLAVQEAALPDAQSRFSAAEAAYTAFAKPYEDQIKTLTDEKNPIQKKFNKAKEKHDGYLIDFGDDQSKWTADQKAKVDAVDAEMKELVAQLNPIEEKLRTATDTLNNSAEKKEYDSANEALKTIEANIYKDKQNIAYPDPLLEHVNATKQYAFTGLQNFARIFTHKDTFHEVVGSFSTTFIIWIIGFIPQILLALLLSAWFTDTKLHLKGLSLMKALMYLPNVITAVSIAIFFQKIFSYSTNPIAYSPAQRFVTLFSYEPYNFLRNVWSTRLIVCFINFWMWYGNTMIVLIAGITSISESLYESAQIDGANSFQTYTKITMPLLRPILLYTMVTSLIGGLQMFDIPANLNNSPVTTNFAGTQISSIQTVLMYINKRAFGGSNKNQVGLASATSVVLFVVTVVLSVLIFYVMRDKDAAKAKKRLKKGGTK